MYPQLLYVASSTDKAKYNNIDILSWNYYYLNLKIKLKFKTYMNFEL